MDIKEGIVREVYIPTLKKQDVMFSSKIGFKVQVGDDIIDIIEEQDEVNAKIFKNDSVIVIEQIVDGDKYISIEKTGEDDE